MTSGTMRPALLILRHPHNLTFVCPACKGVVHDGQPDGCQGGTWCDCGHRLPR
jgi:hypothetical protein